MVMPTMDGYTGFYHPEEFGKVRNLIERGADVNTRFDHNFTPLHLATKDARIAALLIKNGADVNARTKDGRTPLHLTEDLDVLRMLIKNGADVNARNNFGSTPLHLSNDVIVIRVLIENGADINARDDNKSTPLHLAIDDIINAVTLINKGADVNARNGDWNTPLHLSSNVKITELLIKKGANVNARNKNKSTPLHLSRDHEIVKILLEKGAYINVRDKNESTPLHLSKDHKIAQILIEKCADVNALDRSWNTPFHVLGKTTIRALLIENGAKVNATNWKGNSPLHLSSKNLSIAKKLVRNGADVNAEDRNGNTPLHLSKLPRITALLLENGANVNAVNDDGLTALMCVISTHPQNYDLAATLLCYNADCTIPNIAGMTPLKYSILPYNSSIEMIELLSYYDYNLNRDTTGDDSSPPLATALIKSPHYVEVIIQQGGNLKNIFYDTNVLSWCLEHKDPEEFKWFWNGFNYKESCSEFWSSRSSCNSILDFFLGRQKYELFDYVIESCKIEDVVKAMTYTTDPANTNDYLFVKILTAMSRGYSKERAIQAMFVLLSYGYLPHEYEVLSIYNEFNYCELFELCLHLDIQGSNIDSINILDHIFTKAFLNPDINLNLLMKQCLKQIKFNRKFYHHHPTKTLALWFSYICHQKLINLLEELDQKRSLNFFAESLKTLHEGRVPSLLELSRNEARIAIWKGYKIKNHIQFCTRINWMNIPPLIKDILLLKTPLYTVSPEFSLNENLT